MVLGAAFYIRYAVRAPAQAASRYLAAMNGLNVGKTREAELRARPEFQTLDRMCSQGICTYHMDVSNSLLNKLHLAPRTSFWALVVVHDGLVIGVTVSVIRSGLTPISLAQTAEMPSWCKASPCVRRSVPSNRMAGISVIISSDSSIHNHLQEAVNSTCLSRIHGCNTYAELMPVTKELNIEAMAE